MGIAVDGQGVGTLLQLPAGETIAVGIVVIVGSHILRHDGQVKLLALAGGKKRSLLKLREVGGSLFNSTFIIGSGIVQLHNVLAGHIAGVRNLHNHVQLLAALGDAATGYGEHFPVKRGIGKTKAKRIQDMLLIPGFSILAGCRLVGRHGLVVTIAHVDVLAVFHLGIHRAVAVAVIEIGVHAVAILIQVLIIMTKVGESGILLEITAPQIYRVAGGVHGTV